MTQNLPNCLPYKDDNDSGLYTVNPEKEENLEDEIMRANFEKNNILTKKSPYHQVD